MKNIPEKIYLQIGFKPDEHDDYLQLHGITWADHRINDTDLEFGYIPKPVPVNPILIAIPYLLFVVVLSLAVWYLINMNKPRIEQELFIDSTGKSSFPTIIWADGKIVKAWWDSIEISDSLKKARMAEAERILKTIK